MQNTSPPLILRIWMLVTWCLALPITVLWRYLHRRMGAAPERFSERLGRSSGNSRETLWLHAASLGEVKQIGPLAQHLHRTTELHILVTTTTATGAQWAARELPFATHRFAPIDTPAAVRQFVSNWNIAMAAFVEGDLWPRMISTLHKRNVPCVLLNARHSRTRIRLAKLYSVLLAPFALVTCRTQEVGDGIIALGVRADRVHMLPDLRLTLPPPDVAQNVVDTLTAAIGPRPVWLAASTHGADEAPVLEAQRTVLDAFPDALCIIAPRHPVRGQPLARAACNAGFETAQRSSSQPVTPTTQIYIADTLGELGALYTLAPLAFVGGSFGDEGGHTPYEPAGCGAAILFGPNVANFADAYTALSLAGAAVQVDASGGLGSTIVKIMQSGQATQMGAAGKRYMARQQTSIETCARLINEVLKQHHGTTP